jgi:hypothetical protein
MITEKIPVANVSADPGLGKSNVEFDPAWRLMPLALADLAGFCS